jgi:hypothetical protein
MDKLVHEFLQRGHDVNELDEVSEWGGWVVGGWVWPCRQSLRRCVLLLFFPFIILSSSPSWPSDPTCLTFLATCARLHVDCTRLTLMSLPALATLRARHLPQHVLNYR